MPTRKKSTVKKAVKRMVRAQRRKGKGYSKRRKLKRALRNGGVKIPSNVANHCFVKLRYTSPMYLKTLTNTSVINSMVSVRGNNPYDPQAELGGGQPTYYDNYKALYESFVCYGSKISVEFIATNTSNTIGYQAVVVPSIKQPYPISAGSVNGANLCEQRYSKHKRFRGSIVQVGSDPVIKSYMSTKKIWGNSNLNNQYDKVPTDNGTINNPWFWNIIITNDTLTPTISCALKYTITYYCKFCDLRPTNDTMQSNEPDLPVPSMTGINQYYIAFAGSGSNLGTSSGIFSDNMTGSFITDGLS